jgi:arsenical pump membrane protein
MGVVLLLVSGFGVDLGLPICRRCRDCGGCAFSKARVTGVMKDISWEILLLAAGLSVLVEVLLTAAACLRRSFMSSADGGRSLAMVTTWVAGMTLALICNLVNNLPAGLLAGGTFRSLEYQIERLAIAITARSM